MIDTKTKILDAAETLTQTRGFNGFSYLDLADEVGIKTSSIHYHFKAKADLALALVQQTHDGHIAAFADLDARFTNPQKRLGAMVQVFEGYSGDNKFCLCGMLSAELHSVSPAVQAALKAYFDDARSWVARQFKEMGYKDSNNRALSFVSSLEGSLLLARLNGDVSLIGRAMRRALSS